ncbi:hypothetical protein ACH47Z_06435 [Streptomyces sp. NPDC020192]|uniref:hypothetical protein n=1 Tax=Streptomyces sp. NPDC020192 TaxID=3365066 RepID=UPI00379B2982
MRKPRPQTKGPRPVPRDPPDQQAGYGEDRWEPHTAGERTPEAEGTGDVPDVDEAGAGPRGAPRQAGVHPDQPVPDEPSG